MLTNCWSANRWLLSLMDDRVIKGLPEDVEEWIHIDGSAPMYPLQWKDYDISAWELRKCPWWLDYPKGDRHSCEDDLFREWEARHKGKSLLPPGHEASASKQQPRKTSQKRDMRSKKRLDYAAEQGESHSDSEDCPSHCHNEDDSDTGKDDHLPQDNHHIENLSSEGMYFLHFDHVILAPLLGLTLKMIAHTNLLMHDR